MIDEELLALLRRLWCPPGEDLLVRFTGEPGRIIHYRPVEMMRKTRCVYCGRGYVFTGPRTTETGVFGISCLGCGAPVPFPE